jgi:hypothetical protein
MGELPTPTASAGPGTVGVFFARAQGSAPSKGPPVCFSSSHLPSR